MNKPSNYKFLDNNTKKIVLNITIDNLTKKYYAIMNVVDPKNKHFIKYVEDHYENPFGNLGHKYLHRPLKKYSERDLEKLTIEMKRTKKRIENLIKEKNLLL